MSDDQPDHTKRDADRHPEDNLEAQLDRIIDRIDDPDARHRFRGVVDKVTTKINDLEAEVDRLDEDLEFAEDALERVDTWAGEALNSTNLHVERRFWEVSTNCMSGVRRRRRDRGRPRSFQTWARPRLLVEKETPTDRLFLAICLEAAYQRADTDQPRDLWFNYC